MGRTQPTSHTVCLCAVNDFPPASCVVWSASSPPWKKNKKRIVKRWGGASSWEGGQREEEGRDTAYRKQTRPYSTKASEDTHLLLLLLLLLLLPRMKSPSFPLCPRAHFSPSVSSLDFNLLIFPLSLHFFSDLILFLTHIFLVFTSLLLFHPSLLSVKKKILTLASESLGLFTSRGGHESQTLVGGPASQSCYNGRGNILLQLALLVLMSALELETLVGPADVSTRATDVCYL